MLIKGERILNEMTMPLEVDEYYHIYNRGNNRENLFYRAENYRYFLRKYKEYTSEVLDTYAYCLLPNHFHLLVRVKGSPARLSDFPSLIDFENRKALQSKLVSERMRRFFIAYAKAINKQEGRVGSLFQKYFRRRRINDDAYLKNVLVYIHHNPCHHGLTDAFQDYEFSSYQSLISEAKTSLKRSDVHDWFDGKAGFIQAHQDWQDRQKEFHSGLDDA